MAGYPTVMADSRILTKPDAFTWSGSTQCHSETNEVPLSATEMVVTTCRIVQQHDEQRELVTGKDNFLSLHFSDAELIVGHENISYK